METWNRLRQLKSFLAGTEQDEARLVLAAQEGNREAFDALVRAHEPALRAFLLRRVGTQSADDVLQETWLASWQALPRFARHSRFRTWLFGIAAHKCADHHRVQQKLAPETPLETAGDAPDENAGWQADSDSKHAMRLLLAHLPEEQRDVLALYYYADLTLAEVAQALARNLNTVKGQFYRAHVHLAQNYHETDTDDAQAATPVAVSPAGTRPKQNGGKEGKPNDV